jgi:hypothetical protein
MANSLGPELELVRERKLADLIPFPKKSVVLEASGVTVHDGHCFVVFDNVRRIARIGADLVIGSPVHAWMGRWRSGEGYEDLAHSVALKRFFLLVEAEKHPDGSYKAVIDECDESWTVKGRNWVDVPFHTRNRGLEGLEAIEWEGRHYLLAVCEGNKGKWGKTGRTPGGGRIHVLHKVGNLWKSTAVIKLPASVQFKDYAGLSLRGNRLAVLSQESAALWIGTLSPRDWAVVDEGRTYDLPRTKKGKRRYWTVEGVAWLSANTLVMVSDLRKKSHPARSAKTDQSIHVFRVPSGDA